MYQGVTSTPCVIPKIRFCFLPSCGHLPVLQTRVVARHPSAEDGLLLYRVFFLKVKSKDKKPFQYCQKAFSALWTFGEMELPDKQRPKGQQFYSPIRGSKMQCGRQDDNLCRILEQMVFC
jgi:hypothetical protein